MTAPSVRIFGDIETTGLDPTTGALLEVAFLVTDLDCNEIAGASWLLPVDPAAAYELANDYVQKMHTKNGLWEALDRQINLSSPTTEEQVAESILSFLSPYCGPNAKAHLCGFNPGFDLDWLKVHMAQVAACFDHTKLDVRSVELMMVGLGCEKYKGPDGAHSHRGLDDCRDEASALKYYQDAIRGT
jgi:oligoribonuclease (3'-5' exoribonuclease)